MWAADDSVNLAIDQQNAGVAAAKKKKKSKTVRASGIKNNDSDGSSSQQEARATMPQAKKFSRDTEEGGSSPQLQAPSNKSTQPPNLNDYKPIRISPPKR